MHEKKNNYILSAMANNNDSNTSNDSNDILKGRKNRGGILFSFQQTKQTKLEFNFNFDFPKMDHSSIFLFFAFL